MDYRRINILTFYGYYAPVTLGSYEPCLSQEQLMKCYFRDRENFIIRDITTQYLNDDVIICVDYFQYNKNEDGEYDVDEGRNLFYVNKEDFSRCALKDKIGQRIQEIHDRRTEIYNLINEKREYVRKMNERIKPISEMIIRDYLKGEISSDDISMPDFSFADFEKYIEENPTYIRDFIKKNWKYKKIYNLGTKIEAVLFSLGGFYSLYSLSLGEENIAFAIWAAFFGLSTFNFAVYELIEEEFDKIRNLSPEDIEKGKQKKLEIKF